MNSGTLKKLVNDAPLWEAYLDYLDSKIKAAHIKLEQETKPDAMFKIQGEIASLRRLKYMRDEVNGST
jgi:hypothetical protein